MRVCVRLCCFILVAAVCASCGDPTAPSPSVRSLTVSGTDLYPGFVDRGQFKALAPLSDGTEKDVTTQSTWASSNNGVATVNATGEVTSVTFGTVTITARYQGMTGSQAVNVRCGVFLSLMPSGSVELAPGATLRLRTFATFVTPMFIQVDGSLTSSRPDIAAVAPVPQTTEWQLTAMAPGQTTIHATYQCGAADLIVTVI